MLKSYTPNLTKNMSNLLQTSSLLQNVIFPLHKPDSSSCTGYAAKTNQFLGEFEGQNFQVKNHSPAVHQPSSIEIHLQETRFNNVKN